MTVHGVLFFGIEKELRPPSPISTGQRSAAVMSFTVAAVGERKGLGVLPQRHHSSLDTSKDLTSSSDAPTAGASEPVHSEPTIIGGSQPDYPPVSRRLGEEGEVGLLFKIGSDGKVLDASIFKSSGFSRLDESALRFGQAARFRVAPGSSPALEKRMVLRFVLSEK